jgi:predicted nucleic-acid-binding protein
MISIDTNVVVRFLVADDIAQFARAKRLVESAQVFVPLTVLLESEWVLRDKYETPKGAVVAALRGLAKLPTVVVEDRSRALRALDWAEAGMDFADALHLAGSAACSAFASFDRKLAKLSARLGVADVCEP